jgi:hypothetical protein
MKRAEQSAGVYNRSNGKCYEGAEPSRSTNAAKTRKGKAMADKAYRTVTDSDWQALNERTGDAMPFTVVGFYDDSGLRYVGKLTADSPLEAAQQAAALADSICVVAVFAGHVENVFDSGEYVDHAEDLLGIETC